MIRDFGSQVEFFSVMDYAMTNVIWMLKLLATRFQAFRPL
jgi:hypothetical protein